MKKIPALVVAMAAGFAFAQSPVQKTVDETKLMNGYSLDSFGEFWDKWKLVTARYRKDTNEIRFTYANDQAWKTMQSGSYDFKDGSVFGKVAFKGEADELFESSLVPKQVFRYQLMVKDASRFADTRGWGYAIFDSKADRLPGDVLAATKACAACHEYAEPRGFVFLGTMNAKVKNHSGIDKGISEDEAKLVMRTTLEFKSQGKDQLPEEIRNALSASDNVEVLSIVGPLRDNIFSGTLNEIQPVLIKKTLATNMPTMLAAMDYKQWVVVFSDKANKACKGGSERSGETLIITKKNIITNRVESQHICGYSTADTKGVK